MKPLGVYGERRWNVTRIYKTLKKVDFLKALSNLNKKFSNEDLKIKMGLIRPNFFSILSEKKRYRFFLIKKASASAINHCSM